MTDIKKVNEVDDDVDLKRAKKNNEFIRSERMSDAICNVMVWAIYFGTAILGIFIIFLLGTYIHQGKWTEFERIVLPAITYIAGIFSTYLQKNGIGHKK